MKRSSFNGFKRKALQRPGVKREYDTHTPTYRLRKQLIEIRIKAGLTQEELAEILHTKKSNISRLESVNSKISLSFPLLKSMQKLSGTK